MTTTKTQHKNSIERFAVLLPILAGICWGIVGVFVRGLDSSGLDNLTIVFTRTSIGCILSFIFLLVTDRASIRAKASDIPYFLAATAFGSFGFMVVYNIAVIELSLSLATVMLSTAPVFVLIISAIIFKEKITLKKIICMVLAFIGCAMLSGILDPGATIHYSKIGLLMGILTAICNGLYILTSKKVMTKGYGPFVVCFYSFLFASIVLAPFIDWHDLMIFMVTGPANAPVKGTAGAIIYLLIQSIVTSLLPSVAYMYGMKYVDAGKVAILEGGAEPAASLLTGLLIYSELPTPLGFAGMIVAIVAIIVLSRE